jgi:hypothetical protein
MDGDEIAAASEYAVVVANELGSVTSKPATLWPKPIPWVIPVPPGTYIGLFQATNDIDFETSGYFQLKLTTRYAFSGYVVNGGVKYSFTGSFGRDRAHLEIPRAGLPSLLIDLHINHDIGVESITGTVSDGNWTAELISERSFDSSLFSPDAGNYTLVLPPTGEDSDLQGSSCGTLSARANGKVHFVGKLSDYTTACQGVSISRKGRWPLYAKLYKGAGAIQGWITFTNTASASLAGDVRWFKTAPYGRYYPAGFTNRLDVVGSRYFPGVPLNATHGVIVLSGGDLASPLTKQVVLSTNKVFDAAAPSSRQLMTINAKSGAFTGSILADPVKALRVPVKGVVLQQQINGAGFSLGMTNTGSIYLEGQ